MSIASEWNSLPKSIFPDQYNLEVFKRRDWAEFNAATSTIDGLRPSVRSPAASPRQSPRAPRRAPPPLENAYGELRAPPLPPRKSLSPAEPTIASASSVQDIAAASIAPEPRRRSSLEPEPDSRHRLTSIITGSTETITGLIDTRHEVPPDPRAFEKPRRACTPQSNSRPLPAPPPEKTDATTPSDTKTDARLVPNIDNRHERTDRHVPSLPENRSHVIDRPHPLDNRQDRHNADNRHASAQDRHVPSLLDNRPTDRHVPNLQDRHVVPERVERQDRLPERHERVERPERHLNSERHVPNIERHGPDPKTDRNQDRHVPSVDNRERNDRVETRNACLEKFNSVPETRQPPERPEKPSECRSSNDRFESRAPPRQRSLPATTSGSVDHPTKSITMPKFPSEDTRDPSYENVAVEQNELAVAQSKINPLTHDKHGRKYGDNVSYENINLDYIAHLVGEGYHKEIVVRALGITRNDLEMACDILHEFGTKVPNKC